MFSEIVPSSALFDELMTRPENLKHKYFWRRLSFVICENCFAIVFLCRWTSKDSGFLRFERCEHRHDTSIVDGNQEGVKC